MLTMILTLWLCTAGPTSPAPPRLPTGPVPDGLGVNIHFTDPQPGEMEMLASAGFTWVRMDFDWNQVEYERGKYRFDAYDRLVASLEKYRVRPLFILDYVNRHYDEAQSPHSEEAIEAFARFAAAAARRYRGRGVIWEMYNEPNIFPFWRPRPNVADYIRLATAVGKAIRAADVSAAYIGPATSGVDMAFLEACFKAGLLEYWDAVSIHPYRQTPPETVIGDYVRLRELIRRYAPSGKDVPIISGEWGYSSVWNGMDPDRQGKFLPRQWLTNLACDVPLSIWYDWHDDGPDPREPEHHFGTVLNPYRAGVTPVYEPKPAYEAAHTLTRFLSGFRFSKRLMVGDPSHFVLLFRRGRDVRLAVWSTAPSPTEVVIPASAGTFECLDHLGRKLSDLQAGGSGLRVRLTDAPMYLRPMRPNRILALAAVWERLPLVLPTVYRRNLKVRAVLPNVTDRPVRVEDGLTSSVVRPGIRCEVSRSVALERTTQPQAARLAIRVDGSAPLVQETQVLVIDPIEVEARPPAGGRLSVDVRSPSGGTFHGTLDVEVTVGTSKQRLHASVLLDSQRREQTLTFPLSSAQPRVSVSCTVRDRAGNAVRTLKGVTFRSVLAEAGAATGVGASQLAVYPDGDPRVRSDQSLDVAAPSQGPPAPGMSVLRLTYRYDAGWKFVRVAPRPEVDTAIPGKPSAVGMWIWGDGQGNVPRLRFVDATGQTFQPDGQPIAWHGWRYVTFPMDGVRSGHWGGAGDGIIHYPIRWDTYFLLDSAGGQATAGEVYFAGLTLIYSTEETG